MHLLMSKEKVIPKISVTLSEIMTITIYQTKDIQVVLSEIRKYHIKAVFSKNIQLQTLCRNLALHFRK